MDNRHGLVVNTRRPSAPALMSWQTRAAKTLRFARTCYGHLVGMLGVAVADALKASSYLRDSDTGWIVTPGGEAWFSRFGIKVFAQDVASWSALVSIGASAAIIWRKR